MCYWFQCSWKEEEEEGGGEGIFLEKWFNMTGKKYIIKLSSRDKRVAAIDAGRLKLRWKNKKKCDIYIHTYI